MRAASSPRARPPTSKSIPRWCAPIWAGRRHEAAEGGSASTQLVDLEGQAALGSERHRGVDARRLRANVFGAEAAQQDRQGQGVLDLAHGAANAGALAAAEGQVGVGDALFGGVAQPALG